MLSDKLDGLQQKNKELEQPNLSDTDSSEHNRATDARKQGKLRKNKRKKTSQSQQKSLDKMEELKEKLQQAQNQPGESGPPEDMDALRQILENLIDLSLDEEKL